MIAEMKIETLNYLASIGIIVTDNNTRLYAQALTHSSFTYEQKISSLESYERLEFLGDAVLKLVASQYLFNLYPDYREGDLTKIRAVVVSDQMLAEFCKEISLDEHIVLGPSEARHGGRKKVSTLACAFESLLGALYLDDNWNLLVMLIHRLLDSRVDSIDKSKTKDNFKAVLQEYSQAQGFGLPEYHTVKESGPAHKRKFEIEVALNEEVLGWGQGLSKKDAQQAAAKMALEHLNALEE